MPARHSQTLAVTEGDLCVLDAIAAQAGLTRSAWIRAHLRERMGQWLAATHPKPVGVHRGTVAYALRAGVRETDATVADLEPACTTVEGDRVHLIALRFELPRRLFGPLETAVLVTVVGQGPRLCYVPLASVPAITSRRKVMQPTRETLPKHRGPRPTAGWALTPTAPPPLIPRPKPVTGSASDSQSEQDDGNASQGNDLRQATQPGPPSGPPPSPLPGGSTGG